jgi:hypothetical protein
VYEEGKVARASGRSNVKITHHGHEWP